MNGSRIAYESRNRGHGARCRLGPLDAERSGSVAPVGCSVMSRTPPASLLTEPHAQQVAEPNRTPGQGRSVGTEGRR